MSRKGIRNFAPTEPEKQLVRNLVGVGVAHAQIAAVIQRADGKGVLRSISEDTLARHFKQELATGSTALHAALSGRMIRTALGHNPAATAADETRAGMFLLKTKFGYSERTEIGLDVNDQTEHDVVDTAARVAALVERGRRRRASEADPTTH